MSVSIESEGRIVERSICASNRCKAAVDCGFLKFLADKSLYVRESSEGKLVVNCGKRTSDCPRRLDEERLAVPVPTTHEELIRAFPLIPNGNGRRPRRVIGGGHL